MGAQDGSDIAPSVSHEEVADRDSVGREEAGPEEADERVELPSAVGDGGGEAAPEPPLEAHLTHTPRYLWCLDNGHGEGTSGKRSGLFDDGSQLFEYELNRAINSRLMAKLDEIGVKYFNVVPEVEGDILLGTRVSRANTKETDLPGGKIYVSIHANANGNSGWDPANASGIETWFYGGSWRSKKIASAFQRHLIQDMGWKDRALRYHEPYSSSFYVLRKTTMPAVLIENGFYTSRPEAELLRMDEIRDQLANAYLKAILEIEKNGINGVETYKKIYKFS